MTATSYTILADNGQHTVTLEPARHVSEITVNLVGQLGLPQRWPDGALRRYTLHSADGQRISREITLESAGLPPGSTLRLSAFPDRALAAPKLYGRLAKGWWALLGVAILALVFGGAWLMRPHEPSLIADAASPTPAPARPTVTLIPEPPTVIPVRLIVTAIEPQSIIANGSTFTMTVRGSHLSEIEQSELRPRAGSSPTIKLTAAPMHTDDVVLSGSSPALTSVMSYTLVLNGDAVGEIQLQDYLHSVVVSGVHREYLSISQRLFYQGGKDFAAFLWADPELTQSTPIQTGKLVVSNGDVVEILSEEVPQVYKLRVRTNAIDGGTPGVIGTSGWLPRWIIDNTEVPSPPPMPLKFRSSIGSSGKTDAAVQCGTQWSSQVYGQVLNARRRGINNAIVRITSSAGSPSYSQRTNSQGGFSFSGLGCTDWIVELIEVPDAPAGIERHAEKVWVNGGVYSSVEVFFKQQ